MHTPYAFCLGLGLCILIRVTEAHEERCVDKKVAEEEYQAKQHTRTLDRPVLSVHLIGR